MDPLLRRHPIITYFQYFFYLSRTDIKPGQTFLFCYPKRGLILSNLLFLSEFSLCITLFFGGLDDICRYRVKNHILLAGAVSETLIKAMGSESITAFSEDILMASACSLLIMALLFPLYRQKLIGAADIKALMLILYSFPSAFGLEIIFLGSSAAFMHTVLRALVFMRGKKGETAEKTGGQIRKLIKRYRKVPLVAYLFFGAILRFIA